MILRFEKLVIKFITPFVWARFSKRKVQAISRFSTIEKDSAIQLLECLKFVEDPKIKANLFQHVLEELCHADLFESLAQKYSPSHLNLEVASREYLLDSKSTREDFLKFYSYAHVGESEVNEDFSLYAEATKDSEIRKIFKRVAADEDRHEVGTEDILVDLCNGDKAKAGSYILKSRFKRRYKIFSLTMKNIGHYVFLTHLALLYFIGGWFVLRSSRRQFHWSSKEHLNFLRDQMKSSGKGISR